MSRNRFRRGFTLAEVLSVLFVLGLVLGFVAVIVGPLLRSQSQTQAKVDTVQAAAMALYRIERDLRNTTSGSIFVCTTGATPSCSAPSTTLTATSAIVMPTAYQNGTGQFQFKSATGTPNWQGVAVYWTDARGNLDFAFDPPTSYGGAVGNTPTAPQAKQAVIDVTASGGMQLARFVELLSLAVPASHQISFQMQAQSTVGNASNETTYQTDLETRN